MALGIVVSIIEHHLIGKPKGWADDGEVLEYFRMLEKTIAAEKSSYGVPHDRRPVGQYSIIRLDEGNQLFLEKTDEILDSARMVAMDP